jgi:hypothetical protein
MRAADQTGTDAYLVNSKQSAVDSASAAGWRIRLEHTPRAVLGGDYSTV